MFIIAQRWRDVVEAIVGVLATKGICIQCCRSNEKHVPFHYLLMAKLSTFSQSCVGISVDIQLRFGQRGAPVPLHFNEGFREA